MEFAIVGSLLFMVLFGIIQFGLAYYRYQGLNAAAREGARLGALPSTSKDEIATRVKNSVAAVGDDAFVGSSPYSCTGSLGIGDACIEYSIRAANGTVTTADTMPCDNQPGSTVIVVVRYRMEIPIPLWASPTIDVSGNGEFRCEV